MARTKCLVPQYTALPGTDLVPAMEEVTTRHEALAQAHGHVQGELVDALHYAVGRLGHRAVGAGQVHHHHSRRVAQRGGYGARDADGEDLPGEAEGEVPRPEGHEGVSAQPHIYHGEKAHAGKVGEGRG